MFINQQTSLGGPILHLCSRRVALQTLLLHSLEQAFDTPWHDAQAFGRRSAGVYLAATFEGMRLATKKRDTVGKCGKFQQIMWIYGICGLCSPKKIRQSHIELGIFHETSTMWDERVRKKGINYGKISHLRPKRGCHVSRMGWKWLEHN